MDRVADQFISTLKALEFHEKVEPGDLASQLPNERHRRGRCAPCGQQVIHDQHPFSHTQSHRGGWQGSSNRIRGCI